MNTNDAFDVIEAGEGRWDVQLRDSLSIAGHVWQAASGFVVWDWADRQIGVFGSLLDAVRALSALETAT